MFTITVYLHEHGGLSILYLQNCSFKIDCVCMCNLDLRILDTYILISVCTAAAGCIHNVYYASSPYSIILIVQPAFHPTHTHENV